ncbi:long-chain fatty acid transporter [Thraustotheca clavata]|uniref:Very long-chain fatty acid transport protein n=1 Tax=Thraustotheca clavata TaxID=74557 RepID=A0A1V9Z0Z5_9STRA|nr:long-chain fatty acid transporter [Thraustotheca clavata]
MDQTKKLAIAAAAAGAAYAIDKKILLSYDLNEYTGLIGVLLKMRYMAYKNTRVPDIWEELVDTMPSKVMVAFEGAKWTATQLDTFMNRIAHWAVSLGLTPGSVVGLVMENRPEFIAIWMGLAKVGVVAALINTHIAYDGLLHCINISKASVVIFGIECMEKINSVAHSLEDRKLFCYDAVESNVVPAYASSLSYALSQVSCLRPPMNLRANVKITDMVLMIYTSGTTGLPKAARIEHSSVIVRSLAMVQRTGATIHDRLYCPLPLYHTSGGNLAVGIMLFAGTTLVLSRQFSTSRFWDEVSLYRCTMIQYIGEMCRYLLNTKPNDKDRQHAVRMAIGNGLRPDIWSTFQDRFGIPSVCEFYGATEGIAGLVNVCRTQSDRGHLGRTGALANYIAGYVIVEYDVENDELVRNADGFLQECERNQVGELIVRVRMNDPTFKFQGYYNNKEADKKKLVFNAFSKGDLYFRTGDLFRYDKQRCWHFMDRVGDTFRWNGENVATSEVAETLSSFPGLSDICVYGVAVPNRDGKACMAAMVFDTLDMDAFAAFCIKKLPFYAVPRFLRRLPAMAVTGTMKHEKAKLRGQGTDLSKVNGDELYVFDKSQTTYLRLDSQNYHQVMTSSRL